jgi:hypothetical protein
MSTDHMPNPPDRPTTAGKAPGSAAEPALARSDAGTGAEVEPTPVEVPVPLNEDIARVIESQADIIVQRMVYHTQMMLGVSAVGTDPVNAQVATMTVVRALRTGDSGKLLYTLVSLGDAQLAQVNDHTLPFKFNAQVAGLFEGILVDTVSQAYKADPARRREARAMLEDLFIQANEQMQKQPKAMLAFNAPGGHPNARK